MYFIRVVGAFNLKYPSTTREADIHRILSARINDEMLERLEAIKDPSLHSWIAGLVELVEPSSVYVVTEGSDDYEYIRRRALERGEEYKTRLPLQTVHFDGPNDVARDRRNTKILVERGARIPFVNTLERKRGLEEIHRLLKGIMKGREMYLGFYCFGPRESAFTQYAVQVTDSAYVIHNENILYRNCYSLFVEKAPGLEYAKLIHATGERDEHGWVKNTDKRRIYIDLKNNTTYSVNTQYGGNSIGMKKLMFRLCIHKGLMEGWLCEHMFIAGVKGPGDRTTYITGAFPAGCGKTSTAFASDTIVGDDLAIIKEIKGEARAANPETGMFGIIDGVNPNDDPILYKALTSPENEVIFSNILLGKGGVPWWRGKPEPPTPGLNYQGEWWPGKRVDGREVLPSHPNARFTLSLRAIPLRDPKMDDPSGVPVQAMVFGGRDPDTWVPVKEAFNWLHGISTMAAALESEKTAAVIGGGRREFDPFAILDFIPLSIGAFIKLHLDFESRLTRPPRIYSVNYFLRGFDGRYLNDRRDKRVWLKWIDLRVHGEADAIKAPTGLIPTHSDLARLFRTVLDKEYSEQDYEEQFKIRVSLHLAKIERILEIYSGIPDTPREAIAELLRQKDRLKEAEYKYGNIVSPFKLDRR